MDDLFRQASDQYPLRTDSSDWGKLSGALEADPSLISPQVNDEQDNKRRRRRILWLFLPLLAGGAGYYAWHAPHAVAPKSVASQEQQTNKTITQADQVTYQQNKQDSKAVSGSNAHEAGPKMHAPATVGGTPVVGNAVAAATGDEGLAKAEILAKRTGNEYPNAAGLNPRRFIAMRSGGGNGSNPNAHQVNPNGRHDVSQVTPFQNSGKPGSGISHDAQPNYTQSHDAQAHDAQSLDAQYSKIDGPGVLPKADISIRADTRSWQKTAGAGTTLEQASQGKHKQNKAVPHKHSIYVGVLGAPDLSTIDFQAVKSVGTTYGILGGYTFNSKWSVETGVYLDKKKYFTNGQYFDTKNVPALQNPYYDLRSVDGTCNMVEIPVNLRYNLFSGKQRTIFATTGLSTYLMYKEWYAYEISSSYGTMNKSFSYTNPYHYLFSIVNLSFGYEQKLGKIGDLRVEPYLRIPLSGIGTGSLSILSAGLNLGITRRIW